MDRKPYRTLGEGSSSLLKTSFLSACKDGSGMRFLLWRGRGWAGYQMAARPRRFTQHNKRSPLLETSYKNYCLQTEQNMGSPLAALLQPTDNMPLTSNLTHRPQVVKTWGQKLTELPITPPSLNNPFSCLYLALKYQHVQLQDTNVGREVLFHFEDVPHEPRPEHGLSWISRD